MPGRQKGSGLFLVWFGLGLVLGWFRVGFGLVLGIGFGFLGSFRWV